jgi:hypothetical protein
MTILLQNVALGLRDMLLTMASNLRSNGNNSRQPICWSDLRNLLLGHTDERITMRQTLARLGICTMSTTTFMWIFEYMVQTYFGIVTCGSPRMHKLATARKA